MVSELRAWLTDERQWRAKPSNWKSLIRDIERSLNDSGPEVQAALLGSGLNLLAELAAARARVDALKNGPDASLLRRLQIVCNQLDSRLRLPAVLVAAFQDLVRAAAADEAQAAELAARELLDIAVAAGHSRTWFAGGILSTLIDDTAPIVGAPAERLNAVRAHLAEPARRGNVVIWMDYTLAKIGWPPEVKLGDHVALYDDDWLRSCLEHGTQNELPPEAKAQDPGLRMLLDLPPERSVPPEAVDDAKERLTGDTDQEAPLAFIRVELGDVPVAAARRMLSRRQKRPSASHRCTAWHRRFGSRGTVGSRTLMGRS